MRYIFFWSCVSFCFALESLSLQEAMQLALKKNLNIQIIALDSSIADEQETLKYGAFLPQVNIGASATRSHVKSNWNEPLYGVDASLSYTLFDGWRMFYAYDLSGATAKHGQEVARLATEQEVLSIYGKYIKAAIAQKLTLIAYEKWNRTLRVVEDLEKKAQLGSVTSREVLQWKVQQNSLRSQYLQKKLEGQKAIQALALATQASITNDTKLEWVWEASFQQKTEQEWLGLALENNSTLKVYALQEYMARQQQGIAGASYWPWLTANASTGLSSSEVNLQDPLRQASIGLRLNWNIFNGFADRTKTIETSLLRRKANLAKENTTQELRFKIQQNLLQTKHLSEQIHFEKEAFALSKESLDVQQQQIQLGSSRYLDVVDAQNKAEQSEVRLLQVQADVFLLHLELQHLAGVFSF